MSQQQQKFKSDGGSSEYYKMTIKRREKDGSITEFNCEMGDIIYAMVDGDFDLGNVIKAVRRMYLDSLGQGKEGVDADYDAKKIKWFVDDFMGRKKPKYKPHLDTWNGDFVMPIITLPQIIGDSTPPIRGGFQVQGSSIKPLG